MKVAVPLAVGDKQQPQARYPRIFESTQDSTLHILYVAALTAFILWVLAKECKFSEPESLALIVFFVMSIAGAVIGGSDKRVAGPPSEPPSATQVDVTVLPTIECIRGDLHPSPSLDAVVEAR